MADTDTGLHEAYETSAQGWDSAFCRVVNHGRNRVVVHLDRGHGVEEYHCVRRIYDSQSDSPDRPATTVGWLRASASPALSTQWTDAFEIKIPSYAFDFEHDTDPEEIEERTGTQPLALEDPDQPSTDELTSELLDPETENNRPRLMELLKLAEGVDFTLDQSQRLAPRLLHLAATYRDSQDPQDAPAIWAAIRTGASMLTPEHADCLATLLSPGHSVDTSLVTVKMLGRIFEAQPPTRVDSHQQLADRVRPMAESLLNPFAIASSQSAACAQLALYALAAMASSDVLPLTTSASRLPEWFARQTRRELLGLLRRWADRTPPAGNAARDLVGQAIDTLG